jgi:hypothetical protein
MELSGAIEWVDGQNGARRLAAAMFTQGFLSDLLLKEAVSGRGLFVNTNFLYRPRHGIHPGATLLQRAELFPVGLWWSRHGLGAAFVGGKGLALMINLLTFAYYAGLSSLVFCIPGSRLFKDDIPNLLSASFFNQGLMPFIFTAGSV